MLQKQPELKVLYTDAFLADLFRALDELHTAASENQVGVLSPLSEGELVGWLQDLVYTAQETIDEIEQHKPKPLLRLVVRDESMVGEASIAQ